MHKLWQISGEGAPLVSILLSSSLDSELHIMMMSFFLKKIIYSWDRNFNNRALILKKKKKKGSPQKLSHLLSLQSSKTRIIYRKYWKDYEKPPAPCRTGIISSFCRLPAELLPWSFLGGHAICMLVLITAALFWTILSPTATGVNGTVYSPKALQCWITIFMMNSID